MKPSKSLRWLIGAVSVIALLLIFLFQRIDIAEITGLATSSLSRFLINRTIRFLLNDIFAIGLIYALFANRRYVVFAIWVQVIGMVLFLFPYFVLKIYYPNYNGPMINFLHRLILNPTLLLLLIPALYVQSSRSRV